MPLLSPGRWAGIILLVALILFSSTRFADEVSEYAYSFYASQVPPPQLILPSGESLPHLLADKAIHFLLFFALGVFLCRGLRLGRFPKIGVVISLCFLMGAASESFQLLTARDATLADLLLNLASGTLAAVWSSRHDGDGSEQPAG
ncbi:MAG: VanZ family protein [Acidobacteria bacterium]|nr:VanZ family protein [Acidobacteriota bacterium]